MKGIKYSEKAVKQFRQIVKGDKKTASMILKAIEEYSKNPNIKSDIKFLKGKYADFKRLRAGKYRIIFEEIDNVMFVYEVKHRQEAYHD